jgi:porphobilinogen synthase
MLNRPRRNRINPAVRDLVRENLLTTADLIAPLFVIEGKDQLIPVESMPGQYRMSIDLMVEKVRTLQKMGIRCVSLFPALEDSLKDSKGTESLNPDGLFQRAIKEVKNACPDMLVMTDVALDPYSSDGHDGIVDPKTGEILNDETLEILAGMAVNQACAGSDIIGPSDMMDGRVSAIRTALDENGFKNTSIMSYTAKYCSSFYGPFRDALDSAPKSGDKKTYQMDFSNVREAIRETKLDEADVIRAMRENTTLPISVYNVSGEYAMVKAADEKGWIDGEAVMMEMLTSFKRAGADMILTYFAEDTARLLS